MQVDATIKLIELHESKMRRQPRNPKTDPDNDDMYSLASRGGQPVPPASEDGPEWCMERPRQVAWGQVGYGIGGKRKHIRCPDCNRRLLPAESHCVGGEFSGWLIPPHKVPPLKRKKNDPETAKAATKMDKRLRRQARGAEL